MPASAPFKAKAPFQSRVLGLDYQAFPLDFVNRPFPDRFGCLGTAPTSPYNISGESGGPFSTPAVAYTLSNIGGTMIGYNALIISADSWLSISSSTGTIGSNESTTVVAALTAGANSLDPGTYNGSIVFTNTTNDCGTVTIPVSLVVGGQATVPAHMQCRTMAGTTHLCGLPEFTAPSTPPRAYRRQTIGGQNNNCGYFACGSDVNSNSRRYSGSYQYSPTDCTITDTRLVEGATNGGYYPGPCPATYASWSPVGGSIAINGYTPDDFGIPNTYTTVQTQTLREFTFYPTNCGGSMVYPHNIFSGVVTCTREDEDTVADAIVRSGATFGSWADVGGGASCNSATQLWTLAGGFSFAFIKAQIRLTNLSVLSPGTDYGVRVKYYRRAYATSDPFLLYQTDVITVHTDGSGNFTTDIDVPQVPGYEVEATFT